ncbi:MAG: 2OG-Fe dioxygenase family protein [Casimicrobiaceae bacterium]
MSSPSRSSCSAAERLAQDGFAILPAAQVHLLLGEVDSAEARAALAAARGDLPRDAYLADGGRYRYRRHASHTIDRPLDPTAVIADVPYRPHWQPKTYNRLHGGLLRRFAEITPETRALPLYRQLILRFGTVMAEADRLRGVGVDRWYVEAHQFRIDARSGEGRPTPEGAHRDGVDHVLLLMLGRRDIEGAKTSIYDQAGRELTAFTLTEPWSAMLLDDRRVVHGTTPFRAVGPAPERDTLVVTYRRHGFLEPERQTSEEALHNVASGMQCEARGAQRPRHNSELGEGASTAQQSNVPAQQVMQSLPNTP